MLVLRFFEAATLTAKVALCRHLLMLTATQLFGKCPSLELAKQCIHAWGLKSLPLVPPEHLLTLVYGIKTLKE